ncbi:MAG: hypothetical protein HY077_10455 [Elusimicrobia bacterium]|nr:hypothetical protein [Elusimicrobiota bacterium]
MKKIMFLGLLLGVLHLHFAPSSCARAWQRMAFPSMRANADLIVIGQAVAVKRTKDVLSETSFLPGSPPSAVPWDLEGVETTFEVLGVLKGDENLKSFVLHHYELAPSVDIVINGPAFVSFDPNEYQLYLMFLKREKDGRYVSVNGQIDPAGSIIRLGRSFKKVQLDPKKSK